MGKKGNRRKRNRRKRRSLTKKKSNEVGKIIRNITLTIIKNKKKIVQNAVVYHNAVRMRIANFRTGLYKEELLRCTRLTV